MPSFLQLLPSALLALAFTTVSAAGCAPGEIGDGAFVDHDVDEDYETRGATVPGIPDGFTRNNIVSDAIFTNEDLTGDMVQGFLENAPYFGGIRSWLADVEVDGVRASDALVAAAKAEGINPLMLLSRLQVEKGVVSKTVRPSQHSIDYTMGCGCHDNQACNTAFKGFDKQMACAANTLRKHFDASTANTGEWRKDRGTKTLDPITVTPANHATASLYSYTPWVLQGAGGNWLVWNVTKKYANAFASVLPAPPNPGDTTPDAPTPPDPAPTDTSPEQPDPTAPDAWVGTSCQNTATCNLSAAGVNNGECLNWFDEDTSSLEGICSMDCTGYCADKSGEAPTFCAAIQGAGQCLSQAGALNNNCASIAGTTRVSKPRHGGNAAWQDVCAPAHEAITCAAGGGTGTCDNINTNACSGQTFTGACPGPSEIRCCVQ
jgi:hypothetical protein